MNNYYEECLESIQTLIQQDQIEKARMLLTKELSMPYIPQPYYDQFVELDESLKPVISTSRYFEDFDEIIEALHGETEGQIKALMSMQKMNLHDYKEDVLQLLMDTALSDDIKKHILICTQDQNISISVRISINGKHLDINTETLIDPFTSSAYEVIYEKLVETYESSNPSMFAISVEALNLAVFEAYPEWNNSLNAEVIIEQVLAYFTHDV